LFPSFAAHPLDPVALGVDVQHAPAEPTLFVTTVLSLGGAGGDPGQLGEAGPDEGRRGQEVPAGAAVVVQEGVVYMAAEGRLDRQAGQEIEQPGAGRLGEVVVVLVLAGLQQEGRVVHEAEDPPAAQLGQGLLQPGPLLGLQGQAAVQDRGVDA
jgi:hypothetical protein